MKDIDVIIIDDDELLAQMYQMRLQHAGLKVKCAHSAEQFWQIVKNPPKLILLDIILPKTNGLQILKELRTKKEYANTAIILLTNLSRVEVDLTPELADVLGVSAYLVKSQTTPDEVLEQVKKALGK